MNQPKVTQHSYDLIYFYSVGILQSHIVQNGRGTNQFSVSNHPFKIENVDKIGCSGSHRKKAEVKIAKVQRALMAEKIVTPKRSVTSNISIDGVNPEIEEPTSTLPIVQFSIAIYYAEKDEVCF